MLICRAVTGATSELSDDVAFDHDAAFRASGAVEEALRLLDDLADGRVRLAADILCSCSGPYAEALADEVAGATRAAEGLAEDLRRVRSQIAAARDDAFVEQARAEVRRALAAPAPAATASGEDGVAATPAAPAGGGAGTGIGEEVGSW